MNARAGFICLLALTAVLPCAALDTTALDADQLHYRLDLGGWNARINTLYQVADLQAGAMPLLEFASEDADWQVRLTATHFLGKSGDQAAPALARIARSEPCPHIRLSALKWLLHMGGRGEALYHQTATEDDERLMADEPNEYHTEWMGKPLAIDTPNGMTKEFFNGGLDLRVCASSERSGHRHPEWDNDEAPARQGVVSAVIASGASREMFSELPETPIRHGVVTAFIAAGSSREAASAPELPGRKGPDLELNDLLVREDFPDVERLPAREDPSKPGWRIEGSARRLDRAAVADHGSRENLAPFPILPKRGSASLAAGLVRDAGEGRIENDPLPVLIERLASADARRRALAADVLGTRGSAATPAVCALRGVLKKDGDRRVRASAGLALGKIGAADAISDLRRALRDRNEDVRYSAKLALAGLIERGR